MACRYDACVPLLVITAGAWLVSPADAEQTIRAERIGASPTAAPIAGSAVTGTGLITGRVLDAATNQPVAGASVRAGRPTSAATVVLPESVGLPAGGEIVFTNSSGAYVLRDLPKGAYTVSVQAVGYINAQHGQRRPGDPSRQVEVDDDERVLNADVRLWRTASLSGVIVDEAGEPVVGAEVRAFRRTFSGGRLLLVPAGNSASDDRGAYRFGALLPSDYVVVVPASSLTLPGSLVDTYREAAVSGRTETMSAMTQQILGVGGLVASPAAPGVRIGDQQLQMRTASAAIGPDPTLTGHLLAYRTAYHPAGTLSSQAVAITLTSGEERSGADVRLELVPTARVSGEVIGMDGPVPNMPLRLLPAGIDDVASDNGLDAASTVTDANGQFTFLGVPPGEYVLRALRAPRPAFSTAGASTVINIGGGTGVVYMSSGAGTMPTAPTEPTLWAEMPVSVTSGDVAGLTVTLRSGARLSGRVVFDGAAAQPTPEQLQRMLLALRPIAFGAGPAPPPGRVDAELRFTTGQYPPGRYSLTVPAPAPWTLRSVTVAGRDVTGSPLDLADTDLEDVVVTFTDRPASLSGTVRGTGITPLTGATVAIFPSDVQEWIAAGMGEARAHRSTVGDSGAFTIASVLAGEYIAVAIGPDQTVNLDNPAAYAALARFGTRVTITPGTQATVTLSVTSLR